MESARHILITGRIGVGKSTLRRKLLARLDKPVYGFVTRKVEVPGTGRRCFYIFPADRSENNEEMSGQNLLATRGTDIKTFPEVFDTLGVSYIMQAKPDGVILMDELGFMEADAKAFQRAVLDALHGSIPVIACVKDKPGVAFLDEIRACDGASLYVVTEENRDALCDEILSAQPLFNR